ncbi:MAG TPA: L-threonylcarbamoyladenylate synthase [bacterium]|nr:L-threonylcarbamoyladenylate synthase [bacterium]HOL48342.1 L-threonylcarbamoyladenylate synthase [bacterium]HPQ19982.1 L-threonylcarbamoyladenylate synthase [bacterium]
MNNLLEKKIIKAAEIIKRGGIIAFPTETVYGLGADATNEKAVAKIFALKKRPKIDPLIVHINSFDMLKKYVTKISSLEEKIISEFWPGPLTIIFNNKKNIPNIVTANLKSVAIRMPYNPIALKIIEFAERPIAAPSANKFGKLSCTHYNDVKKEFGEKIDLILPETKNIKRYGIESTVIKVLKNKIFIYRPGPITAEVLREKLNIKIEYINQNPVHKLSPGLFKKHYSPDTPIKIIYNENDLNFYLAKNLKIAYITKNRKIREKKNIKEIIYINENSEKEIKKFARNLYSILRTLDKKNYDFILFDSIEEEGLKKAIMDRLKKAAGS